MLGCFGIGGLRCLSLSFVLYAVGETRPSKVGESRFKVQDYSGLEFPLKKVSMGSSTMQSSTIYTSKYIMLLLLHIYSSIYKFISYTLIHIQHLLWPKEGIFNLITEDVLHILLTFSYKPHINKSYTILKST